MTTRDNDNLADAAATRGRYYAAILAAALAGAFSLFVCVMMAVGFVKEAENHPSNSPQAQRLESAKEKLLKAPHDEKLRQEIRSVDKRLIESYMSSRAFYRRGKYLLLVGVVVFLIGIHFTFMYRKRPPMPQGPAGLADARLGLLGRLAVAGLIVALGAGGGYLAMSADRLDYEAVLGVPKVEPSTQPSTTTSPKPTPASRPASFPSAREFALNWPRFRGPGGRGLSADKNAPIDFDVKTGRNIAWKSPIPLPGHSSPVVWGARVFVTGATKTGRAVYCFDAASGKQLWARDVKIAPAGTKPPKRVMEEDTGYAAPTTVADAERVYAIFASGEIVCFDHAGKQVWGRFLGTPQTEFGHGASLAMHVVSGKKARILVQLDQGDEEAGLSRLLALDAATGKTDWQVKRRVGSSWTTPIVIKTPKGEQIITCSNPWVISYDPADGKELWRAECLEGDGAPSPTFSGGFVIAGNVASMMAAIRPDGRGNVTKSHVVWGYEDDLPDVSSPVGDGRWVYLMCSDGLLTCLNFKDGKKVSQHDFKAVMIASPTLVAGRLYVISAKGVMTVVQAGREIKQIAQSKLGEACVASPAFVKGDIFIRAKKHLYCIRKSKP